MIALLVAGLSHCRAAGGNAPGADIWPVVRGDSSLQGIAQSAVTPPLRLAWSVPGGKPVLATPVSDGERVYYGDGDGVFRAVNLKDGQEVWKYVLMNEAKNKPSRDPIEGSACLVGHTVIFGGTDGWVRALEAATGKVVWTQDTKGEIKGGLTPFTAPGEGAPQAVFAVGFTGTCVALHAGTGAKLWEYDAGGPVNGAASVWDGHLVFGGCNGTLDVVKKDGTLARRVDLKIYMPNSVAVRDGLGYCGHAGNRVECYDLATGLVKWEFRDKDFPYFTSPAVTHELVYVGGDDKRLHCLERATGEPKWSFRARDKVTSSPVVAGRLVVFGADDGRLYAVDFANGEEKWSYEIGAPVRASPAVVGGRVLVGADDGVLYCFAPAE
ncbi:MAG: PQQ-binding-like beta-propeller repeat protein [Verrucomicrobiales bacterium]